ncbi:hypothetical protein J2Y69_000651 [Microbacterium resistens]|uniref:Uncharacterized protein n=1 Tax=Microbacterium resistens TaxID=156977 RepID=A0ABU1S8X2_9MICO|nr:hypothetical protein [Microbacterium resistens]MDR6866066.1 hypothetical protein [Microbacterium resistens]
MSTPLILADPDTARDVLTFVSRAARASDDGVRLQAAAGVLVMTAAALAPQGLFDATPTILALRIGRSDPELRCDIVIDELTETEDPRALGLPETGRSPAWAGVSPPRDGWVAAGVLGADVIARRAQWGISAVAHGSPPGAGEDAVRSLRARIWGEPDEDLRGLPRGVAFAAHAFGFISGSEAVPITTSGRWTRLGFARGHVLSRGPAAVGLTAVRSTGTAS